MLPLAAQHSRIIAQPLVLFKLRHQHLILFVTDFGIRVGFYICETFLLQELHSCLETHIAFFRYFIQSYTHTRTLLFLLKLFSQDPQHLVHRLLFQVGS